MKNAIFVLSALAVTLYQPVSAQEAKGKILPAVEKPIALKKGDRIVCFGDSITHAAVDKTGYITIMKEHLAAKHKDLGLELIGAGVGGNKVPDLQKRVDKAVIAQKPTIVFIYIGINDVWHRDFGLGTAKEKYQAGLKDIIGKIQAAGAQVVLCTPSVIGEKTDGSNKHDPALDEYAGMSRAVAKEMKVELCDLRKGFLAQLKVDNPQNKESGVLTGDRVHLNPAGNKLVAEMMLNMLGETLTKPAAAPEKQEKKGEARQDRSISILVGETKLVQASTKRKILAARIDKNDDVAQVEGFNQAHVVMVRARSAGRTMLQLVDEDDKSEKIEIIVVGTAKKGDAADNPNAVRLLVGESKRLHPAFKEKIQQAVLVNENVALVKVDGEGCLVSAVRPGRTSLMLVSENLEVELIDIYVTEK